LTGKQSACALNGLSAVCALAIWTFAGLDMGLTDSFRFQGGRAEEHAVKFKVVLYPSDEGIAVSAPSLPGCWSQGETRDEALENIAIAIREYLEAEIEPAEGAEVREIEVAV
jgi:predicted RNase H-like HicB family nuclease